MGLLDLRMSPNELAAHAQIYQNKHEPNPLTSLFGQVWDGMDGYDKAALAASPVPVVGDIAGLTNDARHYINNPEERTWGNFVMSGIGLLPFVPPVFAATKKATKAIEDPMIVQHNMTIQNLQHADKMGGMAMPSIGISKAENPIEGYGDITLLADPTMAKPSARNPVYSADAYSPTYPQVEYSLGKEDSNYLDEYLAGPYGVQSLWDVPLTEKGGRYVEHFPNDLIERDAFTWINDPAYKAKFLDEKGVMPNPRDFPDRYEWEVAMNEILREDTMRTDYDSWVADIPNRLHLNLEEKLFDGFTDMGNRRYKPHTLDNVLKAMRKDLKDNQTGMFGSGALRAQVAPKFKNMTELKNSRDRLIAGDEWKSMKDELNETMNNKLIDISDKFNEYAKYTDPNPFIQGDMVRDQLTEISTGASSWDEYFNNVPDSLKQEWAGYLDELKNVPTTYFEGKPNRIVKIDEFKGALIPSDTPDDVASILGQHGIDRVIRYKDAADKVEQMKKFKDLYFGGLLGALGLNSLLKEIRAIESGTKTGSGDNKSDPVHWR